MVSHRRNQWLSV